MSKPNADVRAKAKEAKVFLWQIADKLGVSEPTMVRKMRYEMDCAEKQRLYNIIDSIAVENGQEVQA